MIKKLLRLFSEYRRVEADWLKADQENWGLRQYDRAYREKIVEQGDKIDALAKCIDTMKDELANWERKYEKAQRHIRAVECQRDEYKKVSREI